MTALSLPLFVLLAATAPDASVVLKDGVHCAASEAPRHPGETHRCLFEPKAFGKRDYAMANGRAEQVFTLLGPDCEALEILADEEVAGAAPPRRRVSVLCED